MQQEEQNSFTNWKNKLDALDALPGDQALNKTRLWEQLYGRLGRRNRKPRLLRYWMIAASALLIFSLSWLMYNNETRQPVISDGREQVRQTRSNTSGNLNRIPKVDSTHHAELQTTTGSPLKAFIPAKVIQKDSIAEPADPQLPPIPDAQTDIAFDSLPLDTIAAVATVPVRKKLRVVHINDLDIMANPPKTAQAEQSSLIHPAAAPFGYHGLAFSRNASDDFIKIKLSPPN